MLTRIFTKKRKNVKPDIRPNDDEAWDREFKFLEKLHKCNNNRKEALSNGSTSYIYCAKPRRSGRP